MAIAIAGIALAPIVRRAQAQAPGPAPNTRSFAYGLRSETAYQQNPLFVTTGPDDISQVLTGTSSLVFTQVRSSLTLGGQASRSFYRNIQSLNQFTYSGNGAGLYSVNARFSLQGAASYATETVSNAARTIAEPTTGEPSTGEPSTGEPTTGAPAPITPGAPGSPGAFPPPTTTPSSVPVPSTVFHTLAFAGGTTYLFSPRTSAQLQGTFNQVRFDTPGVPDGSAVAATGTMQHLYSERGSVGLVYQFQKNHGVTQAGTIHSVLGSWNNNYERYSLGLQAGVVSNATQGVDAWTQPAGNAQFTYRMDQGAFALHYARSAAQAFGLGKILITDEGSASISHTFGRNSVNAYGDVSRGHDTQLKSYTLDMYTASVGFDRTLIANVKLSASAYYRRRSEIVTADDRGVRVLLAYDGRYF